MSDQETDIDIYLNAINTKDDFKKFLEGFLVEYLNDGDTWENQDLESFLKALIASTNDIENYYSEMEIDNDPNLANWRLFADIIHGAAYQEQE
ncbi:MAG: hypothetical protein SVY10_03530 [Thermodesulfobacteriota bacterium]|nr:hypothetical protein [Thermodesulfobacteriota bacterium]